MKVFEKEQQCILQILSVTCVTGRGQEFIRIFTCARVFFFQAHSK